MMHLFLGIWVIAAIWYKGVWREWEQYHSTMLFFSFMELFYLLIVEEHNYYLWRITPDLFITRVPMIWLYVFIIFPGTALIFLSKYPKDVKKQIFHIAKWVAIYTLVEWVASVTGRIIYVNKWSLFSSFLFDILLFWGLGFHYRKPIMAYILFISVTVAGILAFKIPI